ncbi:Fic family protein [Oharaeibacter diazotrophicus]|nr:Fic family protein [Oharaeibacter diazotrophicus]
MHCPRVGNPDRQAQSATSLPDFLQFIVLKENAIPIGSAGMIESPARMEPCFFEDGIPRPLADLAVEIQRAADGLGRGLHPDAASELADLVRVMNCYYSNLIEGHHTRPRDILRALEDLPIEPERRPLALEARAHVLVQREIDALHTCGALPPPTSAAFVSWIHRRFYEEMPAEFHALDHPDGRRVAISPGAFRATDADDVAVGRHLPPSSHRVPAFMQHFERRFGAAAQWASTRIIAIASAHHRLCYIHPFVDGNGRVARLMSHAMALQAGIGGAGLWSISRGLARGLRDRGEYRRMMDHADSPRRGDLDGRGNLSAAALEDFCTWFLTVALDQIRFSTALFDLGGLEARYRTLVADVVGDRRAPDLVSAVLRMGEMARGDAALVLRTSERTARNTVAELAREGFLRSRSPKAPVRIGFPLDWRERLFPNLFTDAEFAPPVSPPFSPP